MAVVLWQPNSIIRDLIGSASDDHIQADPSPEHHEEIPARQPPPAEAEVMLPIDEDDSNNNEPIRDLNQVDQMLRLRQPPDVDMDEDL